MKDVRKGYIIAGVLGFLTYFVGSTIYYFLTHYLQTLSTMMCMEIT